MIYISYPHIPFDSLVRTSSQTFDSTYSLGNVITGARYIRGKLASAVSADPRLTYDLGTTAGAANTASASHLIIARADLLKAQNVGTITVKAHTSDDYANATGILSDANFAAATLYGPNATDYIQTFTLSAAKRFWYIDFARSSGTTTLEHSKHYLGATLDLGVGPTSLTIEKIFEEGGAKKTTSGAQDMMRVEEPRIKIEIEWEGVSDTLTDTFMEKVAKRRDLDRFFLFTTAQHQLLLGYRVVHVECTEADASNDSGIANWNTISATFEEMIG